MESKNKTVKFDDIVSVNRKLKGCTLESDPNGKRYVTVNQRVLGFRALYPMGSIVTKWLELNENTAICEATVSDETGNVLATAHAREERKVTSNDAKEASINSTSYVENCETSAVGRALGFLGIGCDASIASYEEVLTAVTQQKSAEKVEQAKAVEPVKTEPTVATAATQVVAPTEHSEQMSIPDALAHCGENKALGKLQGKPLKAFVEGSDGKGVHDMEKAKAKLSYIAQNMSGKDSLAAKTILLGLKNGEIEMKPFVKEVMPEPEEEFSITVDNLPF